MMSESSEMAIAWLARRARVKAVPDGYLYPVASD
jgi:hypothetical protein